MATNLDETIAALQEADLLLERWRSRTTFDKIRVFRTDLEKMYNLLATLDRLPGRHDMHFKELERSVESALAESIKLLTKKPAVKKSARPGPRLLYIFENGDRVNIPLPVTRSAEPEPEPEPEPPKFTRFLDLPAHLRLKIAQYAMTGTIPLKWIYKTCTPDRRVGTFKHLDQLTALRRASKQLYQETRGLVWSHNTFEFDAKDLGIAYQVSRLRHKETMTTPTPALSMFYAQAPAEAFRGIKTLCIKAPSRPLELFRSLLRDISKLQPQIKLHVVDLSWTLEGVGDKRREPQLCYWFFGQGCKHVAHQEFEDRIEGARDWRIFPMLRPGDVEAIERKLSAEQYVQVEGWMRDGV